MPFVERPNELFAYGFAPVQVRVALEMVVGDAAKDVAEMVVLVDAAEGVAEEETVMEAVGPHPAEASRRHHEFAYRTTCSRAATTSSQGHVTAECTQGLKYVSTCLQNKRKAVYPRRS
eukprot:SAG31_NODE_4514_length_3175_cov_1.647594_1_plen_118_part_00